MITRTNLNNIQETGRLGNQLWAIASTIGIANKHSLPFYFPDWNYQRWFSHQLPVYYDDTQYFGKLKVYKEKSPYFENIVLDTNYDWDLKGYFQSYKYFENYKENIEYYLKEFTSESIIYPGRVGVHIRRGDYLNLQDTHPVLSEEYYNTAMNKMFEWLGSCTTFVFFSDDIEWCKDTFWRKYGFNFSPWIFHETTTDILDFISLCSCHHFITANSSFSWWAAYLNQSPNSLVISPKVWVLNEDKNDRVPEEWIRI